MEQLKRNIINLKITLKKPGNNWVNSSKRVLFGMYEVKKQLTKIKIAKNKE